MNFNDIRKPSKTPYSLEFHLYRLVMSRNGLLCHWEVLKTLVFLEFHLHDVLMSRNGLLCHQRALKIVRILEIWLVYRHNVREWTIMTSGRHLKLQEAWNLTYIASWCLECTIMQSKSLETRQSSWNFTCTTSQCLGMNSNDIRKPSRTPWSLEFHSYRFVMSRNGLLRHEKAWKNVKIPEIWLVKRQNI